MYAYALLAEWPGSFTCHCGNTGVERTPNRSQHRKLTLEKKIPPPVLPGFKLAAFRSRVRRSHQRGIPVPLLTVTPNIKRHVTWSTNQTFAVDLRTCVWSWYDTRCWCGINIKIQSIFCFFFFRMNIATDTHTWAGTGSLSEVRKTAVCCRSSALGYASMEGNTANGESRSSEQQSVA